MGNINCSQERRLNYLDVSKGIAIILIVIQHAITNQINILEIHNIYLLRFITQFTMPTFFLINGFLFNEKYSVKPISGIFKKVKAYYIPFVKYNLFYLLFHNLFVYLHLLNENYGNSYYDVKTFIKHFFLAITGHREFFSGALWFLGSILIISIIFIIADFVATKICGGNYKYIILTLIVILVAVLGCLRIVPDAMKLRRSFTDIVFFYIGFLIRQFHIDKYLKKYRYICIVLPFIVIVSVASFCNIGIAVWGWQYIFYYLLGIIGAIMLIQFCQLDFWKKIPIINIIGKASMEIMALQFFAFKVVSAIIVFVYDMNVDRLAEYPVVIDVNGLWWVLYTIVGVAIPVIYKVFKDKIYETITIKCKSKTENK